MGNALTFKTPNEVDGVGIGFARPFPLPELPAGLSRLYWLRKSGAFASRNFADFSLSNVSALGGIAQADRFYSDSPSAQATIAQSLNYAGMTFAVAVDVRGAVVPQQPAHNIVRSGDHSADYDRALRVRLEVSGSSDYRFETSIRANQARRQAAFSWDVPVGPDYLWLFLATDNDGVTLRSPGLDLQSEGGTTSDPRDEPDANAGFVIGGVNSNSAPSETAVDTAFVGFAYWPRRLTVSEINQAGAALAQYWGQLGVAAI